MTTFSWKFSEHKTDGSKINNLAALQLNLLKWYVIPEMNMSTIGMTSSCLYSLTCAFTTNSLHRQKIQKHFTNLVFFFYIVHIKWEDFVIATSYFICWYRMTLRILDFFYKFFLNNTFSNNLINSFWLVGLMYETSFFNGEEMSSWSKG